jgi:hypothetical protein
VLSVALRPSQLRANGNPYLLSCSHNGFLHGPLAIPFHLKPLHMSLCQEHTPLSPSYQLAKTYLPYCNSNATFFRKLSLTSLSPLT